MTEPTIVIKEQGISVNVQANNVRDAQHALRLLVLAMGGLLDETDKQRLVKAPGGILPLLKH